MTAHTCPAPGCYLSAFFQFLQNWRTARAQQGLLPSLSVCAQHPRSHVLESAAQRGSGAAACAGGQPLGVVFLSFFSPDIWKQTLVAHEIIPAPPGADLYHAQMLRRWSRDSAACLPTGPAAPTSACGGCGAPHCTLQIPPNYLTQLGCPRGSLARRDRGARGRRRAAAERGSAVGTLGFASRLPRLLLPTLFVPGLPINCSCQAWPRRAV